MPGRSTTPAPPQASPSPATRVRNRRGEGDRLRDELLGAAVAVLAETGSVERTSLRAVAGRAGVSPTAVYRHFADHEDLIDAALTWCWQEFAEAIGPDTTITSPAERFRDMGRRYVEFATSERGKYQVLFSVEVEGGADAVAAGLGAFELLLGAVTDILDANDDPRDPRFVAHQIHAWIHGIVDLWEHASQTGVDMETYVDEVGLRLGLIDPPDGPAPDVPAPRDAPGS